MFGTMPENQKHWEVLKIRDLVTDVKYGTSIKARNDNLGKYQYIRMNNITYEGKMDYSDMKTIDIPEDEVEKCSVRFGDLLFNCFSRGIFCFTYPKNIRYAC